MTPSGARTWSIGVSGWIIQDRNYDDFVVGQESVFAVELIPHQVSLSDEAEQPKASVIQGAVHEFSGQVVHQVGDAWVVDIGLLVYGHPDNLEAPASVGDVVAGVGYLSISGPAVYADGAFVGAPRLRHSWRVQRIERETTPWLESEPGRPRDASKRSFVEVEQTNAFVDDHEQDHDPHYILHCLPLDPTQT